MFILIPLVLLIQFLVVIHPWYSAAVFLSIAKTFPGGDALATVPFSKIATSCSFGGHFLGICLCIRCTIQLFALCAGRRVSGCILFQNFLVEYLRIFYENIIFHFIEDVVVITPTTLLIFFLV